jgi:sigma-B regulation protein RsbU (phosphoserine phosphatase)
VDETGKVLMCADPQERRKLGNTGDPLELATLKALQQNPSGTLLGPGHPPDQVSGFFRLTEAPWTLVMIAPGREVLAPILRFRSYFLAGGAVFILFILVLMRWVTGRTVSSIKTVAMAADNIARGSHTPLLPSKTHDEVGQLIESFNTMAEQLEERIRLKEALDLAMEVQQGLLPKEAPKIEGLDIAGKCIYCDQTGGDYYDFLEFSELDGRIGVVVGDVAGHGIGAALIMATVRSLLRSRLTQPGTLGQVVTDVNRLLCLDTSQSSSFMTLFFMLADRVNEKIDWVRAGHDPAIIYDASTDSFSELRGTGIALGVDETLSFHEYEYSGWAGDQIIVVGTDGIWETSSDQGEMYGKERLLDLIRLHRNRSAQQIVLTITDALVEFRRTAPQQDDVTLVVIKTNPLEAPNRL